MKRRCDYLEPGNGKTKLGYLWTCSRPGGDVFYRWETSRAAACLDNIIPVDFNGTVQCDGYSAYRAFANGRRGIELAGCWAHVRRKFHEALEQSPKTAGWIAAANPKTLPRGSRGCVNPAVAGPVQNFAPPFVPPKANPLWNAWNVPWSSSRAVAGICRKACWASPLIMRLSQWRTAGRLSGRRPEAEIDNNLVENAIRPTAIGKKNWLFMGDADAGERGAIIYTVIESCRRRSIDPYAYLADVLTRLPRMTNWQVPEITPAAWAKARLQVQRLAVS